MKQSEETLRLLQQVELFQGIDSASLRMIAEGTTEQKFAAGEVILREGETGDRLFLLLAGTMRVYVEREGRMITYGIVQAVALSDVEQTGFYGAHLSLPAPGAGNYEKSQPAAAPHQYASARLRQLPGSREPTRNRLTPGSADVCVGFADYAVAWPCYACLWRS